MPRRQDPVSLRAPRIPRRVKKTFAHYSKKPRSWRRWKLVSRYYKRLSAAIRMGGEDING